MILRLVYSFFFFSLVTGNQRLEDSEKTAGTSPCENKICICQQQLESKSGHISQPSYHQESQTLIQPLRGQESHYGYPQKSHTLISSGPAYLSSPTRVETKSYDVEFVSDNVNQGPLEFVREEKAQYAEKTICFTPSMVHRMIKAALEYVSQMPSDINSIIDKIDQDLNRMSDQDSLEEHYVKKPLYPLDSRTIFQMLNKPKSETRTNLILKYELPSVQEPQCKDALEKLIEIAYNAYLELEQHPQCRDYLYRFASQQPDDRPKGHLERGPDLKPLIVSILEQIDKYRPQSPPEYNYPKYYPVPEYDIPIPDIPIPQIHEINIPKIPQITIPQIHEYSIPQVQEINIPQMHEYEIPQIHETIHETIQETITMKPEETINVLLKILQNKDYIDDSNLFDRFMNVVEENQNNFHPTILNILLTLLNSHKQKHVPRFNDILLLLLNSERNRQWPWSENIMGRILSYLLPDRTGHLDSRIVDIILNLFKKPTHEKHIEYLLSLLRPIKEGSLDSRVGDLILKLINSNQNNLLHPEYIDILLKLLKPSQNGVVNIKEIEIIDNLSRWNEMGLSPRHTDIIFTLLKPDINGNMDQKTLDIIHFLLTQNKYLAPKHRDFILSFLYPENGIIDKRRVDIIHFILDYALAHPKHINVLLSLLQEQGASVLNSRFLDILLFLNSNKFLNPELLETVITLLSDELTGNLNDNKVKTFFFQLSPFKQTNPKLLVDILTLLNQGGLHGNIVEWFETSNNNVVIPNRDSSSPSNLQALLEKVGHWKGRLIDNHANDYRTPDGGYTTEDDQLVTIFKWLDSQGLLNPEHGAPNNEMIDKLLKILEVGEKELGVVELTYMLKHEKPLIYQPVYYVKYRLPILSFISNMKNLLLENPQLTTDPMKLLQELIVISNVTEVSPNLQGFPKEEILKLTVTDGDLVQAKILDEQNLNLNEQITYVHSLNSDISPEEILQLNKMNEAKYYPNVLQIKGSYPDKVVVHEVDKIVQIPAVHYQHYERKEGVPHQTHTLQAYDRSHYIQNPYQYNANLRSSK